MHLGGGGGGDEQNIDHVHLELENADTNQTKTFFFGLAEPIRRKKMTKITQTAETLSILGNLVYVHWNFSLYRRTMVKSTNDEERKGRAEKTRKNDKKERKIWNKNERKNELEQKKSNGERSMMYAKWKMW